MSDHDQENCDRISAAVIDTIEEYRFKGYFPVMIVFVSPKDGFEHAHVKCPTGLDPVKFVSFLYQSPMFQRTS